MGTFLMLLGGAWMLCALVLIPVVLFGPIAGAESLWDDELDWSYWSET